MSTCVIHKRDMRDGDVYIGRPSIWGNPYKIGADGSRTEVIQKYREYLWRRKDLLARLGELHGRRLACFCAPQPCHGDVLVAATDWWARTQADKRDLEDPERIWDRQGPQKVCYTGDRNWTDWNTPRRLIEQWRDLPHVFGCARGLDKIGRTIAQQQNIDHVVEVAKWDQFAAQGRRNAAGPERNRRMLDHLKPGDLVYAFHHDLKSSAGTKHCAREALRRGMTVINVTGPDESQWVELKLGDI